MANYDKWTKGAVGHLCKHFERAKDENGEYVKFGNRDIDPERTHLNYNLAPDRQNQYGFVVDRCKELKCLNRKDVNMLSSWIVTAPQELPDEKLKDFFQASYNALEKKYGKENVVSAYVHMDESGRPHMHFAFVPVVWDKKKEAYKVSAKQCVNRTELQNFHPWLEQELQQRLGYAVPMMNDATKDGNKTITELKRERELAKQAELAKATEEASERLEQKLRDVGKIEERLNALKSPESVENIEGKVSITGRWVKVRKDEYELLKEHAVQSSAAMDVARDMSDKAQEWKSKCADLQERANNSLKMQIELANMRKELADVQKLLKRTQERYEQMEKQVKLVDKLIKWLPSFISDKLALRELEKATGFNFDNYWRVNETIASWQEQAEKLSKDIKGLSL